MVEAVESYTTYDGKIFLSEESAIRHEAVERLCEILPELRLIRPRLDCNLNAIANAVGPISAYGSRVPYEGPIADPIIVDHGELAGTCSCSAGMNGALDHARDCPSYRALFPTGRQIYEASKKSRLDVRRPVAGVSRG